MKRLYIVWVAALILIVIISLTYRGESTSFYGIADAREVVINSENAVEIKAIHVVQGQVINKNDTLIELCRPELTMKINEISHDLNELMAQKMVNTKLSRSQILQLKAKQAEKVNEIKSQIEQLEAQLALNKNLTSGLKSIKKESGGTNSDDANNPIKIQLANLKKELAVASNLSQPEIDMLQSGLYTSDDPVKIQIQRLEKELQLLLEEKEKLIIFAQIDGIIGSVNFREGEMVSPFTPIITLHTKSPSFVKGYIHENVYNKIEIGQKVRIHSMSGNNSIEGDVVGVGSRIVDYPVRLRKRQDIQIWGREVIIKIPENSAFLLGEKVRIADSRF